MSGNSEVVMKTETYTRVMAYAGNGGISKEAEFEEIIIQLMDIVDRDFW